MRAPLPVPALFQPLRSAPATQDYAPAEPAADEPHASAEHPDVALPPASLEPQLQPLPQPQSGDVSGPAGTRPFPTSLPPHSSWTAIRSLSPNGSGSRRIQEK